jgi:hypothetical protein
VRIEDSKKVYNTKDREMSTGTGLSFICKRPAAEDQGLYKTLQHQRQRDEHAGLLLLLIARYPTKATLAMAARMIK